MITKKGGGFSLTQTSDPIHLAAEHWRSGYNNDIWGSQRA